MDHNQSTPSSFLCSITHQLMTDPYVDHEGNTYEKAAKTKQSS